MAHPRLSSGSSLVAKLSTGAVVAIAGIVLAGAPACSTTPDAGPVVKCDSTVLATHETFALADVAVHFEGDGPRLGLVRNDVASYLGRMWGAPGGRIDVPTTKPDFGKRVTIWISTSDDARRDAGSDSDDGYAIKRIDYGGKTKIIVAAKDAEHIAYATYALLEELGARFFHPRQELVPAFATPRIPRTMTIARRPTMAQRGLQLHTLHPIEYLATLNDPTDEHLAEARQLIDWLVKTGQNHIQWPLLATVDFEKWKPFAQAILDYAHLRGVTVGAVVQTFGGSALQNNWVLITSSKEPYQPQIEASLDRLFAIRWDYLELALGEFFDADPHLVVAWLDHALQYAISKVPELRVDVQNHVGNYANLFVQYDGKTEYFYNLPRHADPRLGQSVHTLAFYDLYRPWATYAHEDFHAQHEYLFEVHPARRVSYFPESAYWITADIDVPQFLPMFVEARFNDITGLTRETKERGLPPVYGHIMFSSGHEWGYWMTDYLAARIMWQPEESLEHAFGVVGSAYGNCGNDVAASLAQLTALQKKYLFDQRLAGYLAGEDQVIDLGYISGFETHARRVAFEKVITMTEPERVTFERDIVAALEAMAKETRPIEDALAARCRGSDATLKPWCEELEDGTRIVRLRLEHTALLYRAVLAKARNQDGSGLLARARSVTGEARTVIEHREKGYRFDPKRLTDAYVNVTRYPFGYLRQAHTQCFWRRREEQVAYVLEFGVASSLVGLPSCLD